MTHKKNGHAAEIEFPPASPDTERAVLACMMLDVRAAGDPSVARLVPVDFSDPEYRVVFRHLCGLYLDGKPTDIELLNARIEASGEIPDAKARKILLESIIESQATAAHVRHYADIVFETARRREQWLLADQIKQQVKDGLPPDDISGSIARFLSSQPTNKQESPTMRNMQQKNTALRPPIVLGLLREGETLNIIAPPKVGKSWLVTDLALCVVTGASWLGKFQCKKGQVLIVDNELHAETSTFRIPKVGDALGIPFDEYADDLRIENVRGRMMDIYELGLFLNRYQPGQFKLIVLDAFYKFLSPGVDENSNTDMARMYAIIDSYAARLRCSFACVHHASKGNQSGKAVTDVGAGAGAQSRATDTHFVLRQHEQDGVYVVDGVTRSFAPFEPFCLRWDFPTWTPAPECDPAELRRDKRAKEKAPKSPAVSPAELVERFASDQPKTMGTIIAQAVAAGIPETTATKTIKRAAELGLIHQWPNPEDGRVKLFATIPPIHQNQCSP